MPTPQPLKKVRVLFPKKGILRKGLLLMPNLARLENDPARQKKVLESALKNKRGRDQRRIKKIVEIAKNRRYIIRPLYDLVAYMRKKNPQFWGVILYGGVAKKSTPPTDVDIIFVGKISEEQKKVFLDSFRKKVNLQPHPMPVDIDLENNPKHFEKLLKIPYLLIPEDWMGQNFIGPIDLARKVRRAYQAGLKSIAVEKAKNKSK